VSRVVGPRLAHRAGFFAPRRYGELEPFPCTADQPALQATQSLKHQHIAARSQGVSVPPITVASKWPQRSHPRGGLSVSRAISESKLTRLHLLSGLRLIPAMAPVSDFTRTAPGYPSPGRRRVRDLASAVALVQPLAIEL